MPTGRILKPLWLRMKQPVTRPKQNGVAGIILANQQQYSVGEQMRRILRLIAAKSAEEMRDWVEFLSAW